jgi:hypothetical protein
MVRDTVSRTNVRSLRGAAGFVNRAGIALVFPEDEVILPALWEAVVGDSELTVFTTNQEGRRVLTPELERVWTLKNKLAENRLACVGKHVRRRLALISLQALPALYALTGRSGLPEDFREPGLFSSLELDLAEALLELGARTAPDLRRVLGLRDAKETKRALENLQRQLVATQVGDRDQPQGWAAAVFDIASRRYRESLRRLPDRDRALADLAEMLLRHAGQLSAAEAAAALGCSRADARQALDRIVDLGRAERHLHDDIVLWVGITRGRSLPAAKARAHRPGAGDDD